MIFSYRQAKNLMPANLILFPKKSF